MKRVLIAVLIIFAMGLLSCNPTPTPAANEGPAVVVATGTPASSVPDVQPTAPAPEQGKGNMTGYVVSTITNQPIASVPVILAEVVPGTDKFLYDGGFSPVTYTDNTGYFIFDSIDVKDYVLVIGSVEINSYKIIEKTDGSTDVFSVILDETVDIGTIQVPGLELYVQSPPTLEPDSYPSPDESYP